MFSFRGRTHPNNYHYRRSLTHGATDTVQHADTYSNVCSKCGVQLQDDEREASDAQLQQLHDDAERARQSAADARTARRQQRKRDRLAAAAAAAAAQGNTDSDAASMNVNEFRFTEQHVPGIDVFFGVKQQRANDENSDVTKTDGDAHVDAAQRDDAAVVDVKKSAAKTGKTRSKHTTVASITVSTASPAADDNDTTKNEQTIVFRPFLLAQQHDSSSNNVDSDTKDSDAAVKRTQIAEMHRVVEGSPFFVNTAHVITGDAAPVQASVSVSRVDGGAGQQTSRRAASRSMKHTNAVTTTPASASHKQQQQQQPVSTSAASEDASPAHSRSASIIAAEHAFNTLLAATKSATVTPVPSSSATRARPIVKSDDTASLSPWPASSDQDINKFTRK